MTNSEEKYWQKVHPEPTSKLLEWAYDKMAPEKAYSVTPDQVAKIKSVWDVLNSGKYEYSFNDNFTKFRKYERYER